MTKREFTKKIGSREKAKFLEKNGQMFLDMNAHSCRADQTPDFVSEVINRKEYKSKSRPQRYRLMNKYRQWLFEMSEFYGTPSVSEEIEESLTPLQFDKSTTHHSKICSVTCTGEYLDKPEHWSKEEYYPEGYKGDK